MKGALEEADNFLKLVRRLIEKGKLVVESEKLRDIFQEAVKYHTSMMDSTVIYRFVKRIEKGDTNRKITLKDVIEHSQQEQYLNIKDVKKAFMEGKVKK